MRLMPSKGGPFPMRPYYDESEIDRLCVDELGKMGLLPRSPEPVRVDRFIEKRFCDIDYDDLPSGVLGYTKFEGDIVREIVISRQLDADSRLPRKRQLRATLAHEAGHGLLHAPLFKVAQQSGELFEPGKQESTRVLCRDVEEEGSPKKAYDGKWWEYQANMVIGSLLLPSHLVDEVVKAFCRQQGLLKTLVFEEASRQMAIRRLVRTFDVNPAVARIRLEKLYPVQKSEQMML